MKLLLMIVVLVGLSACAQEVEMAKDPVGTDTMRISPCACAEIPYEFEGFEWTNA